MNINDIFKYIRSKKPQIEEYENDYRALMSIDLLIEEMDNKEYKKKFKELIKTYTKEIMDKYNKINIEGINIKKELVEK